MWSSNPPPREYVACPQCSSPHAFVTIMGIGVRSCFCPLCKHIWRLMK